MVAEQLEMDHIPAASSLLRDGDTFTIRHEIVGGTATSKATAPLVISCQKGMAESRIPNMKGIMSARTKPLNVVNPIPYNARTVWKEFTLPPVKTGVTLIPADQPEELIRLLHEEAKVL